MSKTIKVIDLLNKIANGEEVPKKIKYDGELRIYDENDKDYCKDGSKEFYLFFNVLSSSNGEKFVNRLNDTVEIIEEQKEIDIQPLNPQTDYFKDGTDFVYKLMYDKINELVQAVKQLDKKIKEKE